MSQELNERLQPLGPLRPTTKKSSSRPSSRQKLIDIRPKGTVVVVTPSSPAEFKRRQHALSQKNQRDRMKAALEQMAQILESGGVSGAPASGGGQKGSALSGSKVELVEAAVEYIQGLQREITNLKQSQKESSSES